MTTTLIALTQPQATATNFPRQMVESNLPPKSILTQASGPEVNTLNDFSGRLLETFADLGNVSVETSLGTSLVRGALNLVGDVKTVLSELARLELEQVAQEIGQVSNDAGKTQEYLARYYQSSYAPSTAMRAVASVGSMVSAATGVIDVAREFRKEFDAQETLYPKTLIAILKSVGQTASGYAAGVGTASLSASMLSGVTATTLTGSAAVAAAPVVLGVAAGLAATAAVNQLYKWLN